jgi:murein DD-endopeptidase MepM/ murein hydrolase activator NlpD
MTPIRPGSHITTPFGHDIDPIVGGYRFHRALDRAGGDGLVYCPMEAHYAVIEYQHPDFGTLIRLFYQGFEIRLAHCKDFNPAFKTLVATGSPIPEGLMLAHEGSLGKATGPHTHIELVVTGSTRCAEIDKLLTGAGIPLDVRYTAGQLIELHDAAAISDWMMRFGCKAMGPHECWCWDRRSDSNGIWVDPMAVGL